MATEQLGRVLHTLRRAALPQEEAGLSDGQLLESYVHGREEAAFAALVRRFQDMAVGYACSVLKDFQLAEDAAQEAFFEAYRTLGQLREPAAFAGWFRRIVFKQCDRITRDKRPRLAPIATRTAISR